jgi:hypothetical protein
MRQRLLQWIGRATTVVVVSLEIATLAGQAPTPAQKGPAAKTSWGESDLQGIWGLEYQIPLQRPEKYKNKEFFADAEIAALERNVPPSPGSVTNGRRRGPNRTWLAPTIHGCS